MTPFRCPARALALAIGLAAGLLAAGAPARAQSKDDALEKLLKELDQPKAKGEGLTKPAPTPEKPKAEAGPAKKPPTLRPEDQGIDDLLGKLGATEEKAAPDEKKPSPPMPGENDKPEPQAGEKPEGGEARSDPLQPQDKALDEALRERTGKRSRKKDGEGEGEGQGPLGDVIKQMREVEKKLGETDTGEQTRKRQTQIVEKIDGLIAEARKSQGQSKSMKKSREKPQGQQQQGQQQGNTPGTMAGNAPNQKPEKPSVKSILALDKNAWGHLEDRLREEMSNVFREVALPAKEDLVKKYYLAVSKKSLSREE